MLTIGFLLVYVVAVTGFLWWLTHPSEEE